MAIQKNLIVCNDGEGCHGCQNVNCGDDIIPAQDWYIRAFMLYDDVGSVD
jgi:hypothetical protein